MVKGYAPEQLMEINVHRKQGRKPLCVSGVHPAEVVALGVVACVAVPGLMIAVHAAVSWFLS